MRLHPMYAQRENGRELEGIERFLAGEEMGWFACSETVSEFGKCEAGAKEEKLSLCIPNSRKTVEDFGNLAYAVLDCVAGERNVSHWSLLANKSRWWGRMAHPRQVG